MPRYNVQHPVTKEWRCFSTIVDDYVTDWMDEERYQRWRLEQYGKQAGEIRDANLMYYEKAEQIIADRKRWEEEEERDMSRELKPCPFCGGKAERKESYKITGSGRLISQYCIKCGNERCSLHVATCNRDTEEEAVEIWNRRVTE